MPPPTAMKSLWQDCSVTCATLNRAASRLSITILRPLIPPEALHQSAKAWACSGNSASRPGSIVLAASLNTAKLMVLSPTPRTEDAPPGPASQILPTPGHSPLVGTLDAITRLDDVAAPVPADDSDTNSAARTTVAVVSRSAVRRRSTRPLGIPFISTPEHAIGTFNQEFGPSGVRLEEQENSHQDPTASAR